MCVSTHAHTSVSTHTHTHTRTHAHAHTHTHTHTHAHTHVHAHTYTHALQAAEHYEKHVRLSRAMDDRVGEAKVWKGRGGGEGTQGGV